MLVPNDRLLRSTIAAFCLALGIAAPESVAQQPARPPFPDIIAPGVVLSFEGGQPGNTVADVLSVLQKNAALLRQPAVSTEVYKAKPGDSVCRMLAAANYPLPCGDNILSLVEQLNPDSKPVKKGLQVKQEIVIPKPDLYKYSVTRYFPEGPAARTEADDILKNWTRLNAKELVPNDSGHLQVRYDAYRMFVATRGDEESFQLAKDLIVKVRDSANLKLDVILKSPVEKQQSKIPTTVDEWEKICLNGELFKAPKHYRDMADIDRDAIAGLKLSKETSIVPVPVHIVDVALNDSPVFLSAVPPGMAAMGCKWTDYVAARHHSTHMASIIASRNSGLGFLGLAPNADVDAFEWLKASGNTSVASSAGRALLLSDMLSNTSGESPMHVYLIATVFPQSAPKPDQPIDRFREGIAARIDQTANLFIIAAGQDSSKKPKPVELSPKNDTSPQNLGDLRNVVVVTACNPCTRNGAKLMQEANYSHPVEGKAGVHVAAPGGAAVGAWVDAQNVTAAIGTSQAAAYVAGVAAAMIGRSKDAYRTAESVKRRLQVTSRPTNWDKDDATKLAAGGVDPVLALFDPKQHWLKRGSTWEPIRIKSLTGADGMIKSTDASGGAAKWIPQQSMMRFVRTTDESENDHRWEIYQELWKAYPTGSLPAVINRVKNLIPAGEAITLCDDRKIAWNAIADLIIADGGVNAKACSKK